MLKEYRKEIDEIDNAIINLLVERSEVVKKVKEYKLENNIEILDANREDQIIDRIVNMNLEIEDDVIAIFELMMSLSKKRQIWKNFV